MSSSRAVRRLVVLASAICAVAVPSVASAADIVVNDDSTGPGPGATDCTAATQTTIQGAVTAAAPGDRILVCAGTYNEPQVLVSKSLDIIGAGPGQTILDGGTATGLPSGGLIRVLDSTNGDVLISGLTTRNPGQAGAGASTARFHIVTKSDDLGTTYEISNVEVDGGGAAYRDYGVYADGTTNDLIIEGSSIAGTDFNPILLERATGASTIRDNFVSQDGTTSTSAIFVFTYQAAAVTQPQRILRNTIDANGRSGIAFSGGFQSLAANGFDSVEIRDNTILDVTTNAISISNVDPVAGGQAGEIANVSIEGNTLSDREDPATSRGIRILGRVRNVDVRSNTITGLDEGVTVVPMSGAGATGLAMRFNRIAGNGTGLTSTVTEPVDAERNWWGCNEGPNQPGCDTVTGAVDFDPWLVLGLTANPTTISTDGDTSELTADLTQDSDGAGAGPGFPEGTPIAFATDLGTVASPRSTADGVAMSTLTSGDTEGVASTTATLDSETANAPVTIVAPPEPAVLRLKVSPRRATAGPGRKVRYTLTARNTGETDAANAQVCLRGSFGGCKAIGTLAAGDSAKKAFRVGFNRPGIRTLRFRLVADAVPTARARARLRTTR